MDPQAFANAVAQAVQTVMNGLPAPAQPDPQAFANAITAALNPPAAAGPFALAPALTSNGVIDYSTSSGAKVFSKATAPLSTTFSLEKPNPRVLLEQLTLRSATYGWNVFLNVPTGQAPNQVNRNMLSHHGQITLDECLSAARGYIGHNTRAAQADFQLLSALTESIDAHTTAKMSNEAKLFTITVPNPNAANPGQPATISQPSGLVYLKVLISKAMVDSRAVGSHVRGNLAKLDVYMEHTAKDDILVFNDYVREQLALLAARGESSTDVMDNLFNGYLACNDKGFKSYIERIQHDWQDDPNDPLTHETLMSKTDKHYQSRVLACTWMSVTKEQEQIVALRAELNALRTKKSTGKDRSGGKAPKDTSTEGKKKKEFRGKWAWRNVAPKSGEATTKDVDGETWHYCKFHGYWCKHTSEECSLNPINKKKKANQEPTVDLRASLAAVGISETDDDEDASQE